MRPNKYLVRMEKGGHIALHHFPQGGRQRIPVVVTHGTISNGDAVKNLAIYLHDQGFDCWLLEWGGHGESEASSRKQDFEYPALNDVPAAIEAVLEKTRHNQVYWVSHSGGGHLVLMCLSRLPEFYDKVAGIVSMGAQATDGAIGFMYKSRALLIYVVTKLFGRMPKALVSAGGSEGEPTQLLAQWAEWNLKREWRGKDGYDYLSALANITHPAFFIAGGKDDIAPVSGCKKLYDGLGSVDKQWMICAREHGFSKDFNHGQLVLGSTAKNELFPLIAEWLAARNTPGV